MELNLHWSHGRHWFDETNIDDKLTANMWIEKAKTSDYYQAVIDVWTKRDVLKRETAKKNHLNYIVFWKQDLLDFHQWIENGCQIINSY